MNLCKDYRKELMGLDAKGILRWTGDKFGPQAALAASFGAEDQVLIDLWVRIGEPGPVFTLDTGRFFEETYDVMDATMERYALRIELYAPSSDDFAGLIEADGGKKRFFQNS